MFDHLRQKSAEESGITPTPMAKPAAKPTVAKAADTVPDYMSETEAAFGAAAPAKPKKKIVRRKKKAGLLDFFTPFQRFLLSAFLFFSVSTMGCVLLFALQRLKLPF